MVAEAQRKYNIPPITADAVSTILDRVFPSDIHGKGSSGCGWVVGVDYEMERLPDNLGYWNPIYKITIVDGKKRCGVDVLALKITNPHWLTSSKTQNEATIMKFLSSNISPLLSHSSSRLVPHVYEHSCGDVNAKDGFLGMAYIVMDFIPGKNLGSIDFDSYPVEKRHAFLEQLAEFYVATQSFHVTPQQIGCFQDLQLTNSSSLHTHAQLLPDADTRVPPCSTYQQWVTESIRQRIDSCAALVERDREYYEPLVQKLTEVVTALEAPGILDCVTWNAPLPTSPDHFPDVAAAEANITATTTTTTTTTTDDNVITNTDNSDDDVAAECRYRLTICHSDMQATNILVDAETLELKGVIDWEWASLFVPLPHMGVNEFEFLREKASIVEWGGEVTHSPTPASSCTRKGDRLHMKAMMKKHKERISKHSDAVRKHLDIVMADDDEATSEQKDLTSKLKALRYLVIMALCTATMHTWGKKTSEEWNALKQNNESQLNNSIKRVRELFLLPESA